MEGLSNFFKARATRRHSHRQVYVGGKHTYCFQDCLTLLFYIIGCVAQISVVQQTTIAPETGERNQARDKLFPITIALRRHTKNRGFPTGFGAYVAERRATPGPAGV